MSTRQLTRRVLRLVRDETRSTGFKRAANLATVIGVLVTAVSVIVSNCNTQTQLELATRPYLIVTDVTWSMPSVVSGDVGLAVAITLNNTGEKPARSVHIRKDFVDGSKLPAIASVSLRCRFPAKR